MILKTNINLLKYKKGALINFDLLSQKEKTYFSRRLVDAKIDNCVEIVNENKEIKNDNNKTTKRNSK